VSENRTFLVTGATGVVGSTVVPLLLQDPTTRVHMLLRAHSAEALRARVGTLLEFWGHRVDRADLDVRLFAIPGDVGQPNLGMHARDYDALAATVTNIVHSAGEVKLNQSIEQARKSASFAGMEVVRFARACARSRSFPKIEHLSTVGVAGRRPGLISEEPVDTRYGFHNTYEQAKAETEAMLLRQIDEGLPVTLHRPSMVVGDAREGRIVHFQVFYHLARFIAGSRTRGILPYFGGIKLDIVPVDYVAKAIVASALRSDSRGMIFHLCSGPDRACTLEQLGDVLRTFLHEKGENVFAPRYIPRKALGAAIGIARLVTSGGVRRSLSALPFFLDYLAERQTFADQRTAAFFRMSALECPPVPEFLPSVLRYWYAQMSTQSTFRGKESSGG
jgi:thioester reductase-like protein